MSDAPTLNRNDRRILAAVCETNGGGCDLTYELRAPRQRLLKAGLIQRKKHPIHSWLYVHTAAGLKMWREIGDV